MQAGGSRLTPHSGKGTIAPHTPRAQRLHFSVPSIFEHMKILNSIGLSLSEQLHYSSTSFPVTTKKLAHKHSYGGDKQYY